MYTIQCVRRVKAEYFTIFTLQCAAPRTSLFMRVKILKKSMQGGRINRGNSRNRDRIFSYFLFLSVFVCQLVCYCSQPVC
jgi:hypothetical protein